MSVRIITARMQSTSPSAEVDGYFDRIVKYVPVEVVSAWIAATALIESADTAPKETLHWIVFFVGLVLVGPWRIKLTSRPGLSPAVTQAVVATAAYAVWIFAMGGPFASLAWYQPVYGGLALIFFLLAAGLIVPPEQEPTGE